MLLTVTDDLLRRHLTDAREIFPNTIAVKEGDVIDIL